MKLNKTALGLAMGILCGAAVFVATLWVTWAHGGDHLSLLSRFYIGYSISYFGAFLGLVYGFIDGFIAGWLLAWLYNAFARPTPA
jgi:hypothetical protein